MADWQIDKKGFRIEEMLEKLTGAASDRLMSSEEFVLEFMEQMGGPKSMAHQMAMLARNPETRPDTRRRIFEFWVKMAQFVETLRGPAIDFSKMDEAEVRAVLKESLERDGVA